MSLSEGFGHVAFLLAGTAFLDPDILNLRLLSVASGGATLVFAFFHPVGYPLWLPFGWNLAFMAINGGHIYRILTERWEADHLPPAATELWKHVFEHHGVSAVGFAKLLGAGTWTTLRAGAMLQEEGRDTNSVFLLVRGGADVKLDGDMSHTIGPNQFVGDMGLSSGISIAQPIKGIATVTTNQQTTCLAWPRDRLHELLSTHPHLAAAFQAAVAADVMRNLHHDRENHQDMWRARYAAVLEALLSGGRVSEQQRIALGQFRSSHRITAAEHAETLHTCGWSADQFEEGTNGKAAPADAEAADTDLGQIGWVDASDPQGEGAPSRVEPPKPSDATVLGAGVRPLAMWDTRKDEVAAVQERLNAFFGTAALQVDGSYGPLTQQAVELFQVKMGLAKVDGKAGPVTWRLLRQAHRRKIYDDSQNSLLEIVRGFETDDLDLDVVMLQQKLLTVMGPDCGVVADGVYGETTQRVMSHFMASNGIRSGAASSVSQLTPAAAAMLRDRFMTELESKALRDASTAATESVGVDPDQDIKMLQLALNQLMQREVVTPDGVYGPRTRTALTDFQSLFGLPAEGDVGQQLTTVMGVMKEVVLTRRSTEASHRDAPPGATAGEGRSVRAPEPPAAPHGAPAVEAALATPRPSPEGAAERAPARRLSRVTSRMSRGRHDSEPREGMGPVERMDQDDADGVPLARRQREAAEAALEARRVMEARRTEARDARVREASSREGGGPGPPSARVDGT